MASLRTSDLEWNPDTDLLMSKLRHVEEERSVDHIQAIVMKLVGFMQLRCCMEAPIDKPVMIEPLSLETAFTTKCETPPENVPAATAPDHSDDEDNLATVALAYPPTTKDDNGVADTLPQPMQAPPPTVFTHDQTPCNSPRSLMKKQNKRIRECGDKQAIQEESGSNFEEDDSQLGTKKSKPKSRSQQFVWRNPLKRRARR